MINKYRNTCRTETLTHKKSRGLEKTRGLAPVGNGYMLPTDVRMEPPTINDMLHLDRGGKVTCKAT